MSDYRTGSLGHLRTVLLLLFIFVFCNSDGISVFLFLVCCIIVNLIVQEPYGSSGECTAC